MILNVTKLSHWHWPDFSPSEMACRHCGDTYVWPEFMARLQAARTRTAKPFLITSGHRCSLHNARIGGAPLSQHLKLAADISLYGHDRAVLYAACRNAGFTGFGFYSSFLHVDLGHPRRWFGSSKARNLWQV